MAERDEKKMAIRGESSAERLPQAKKRGGKPAAVSETGRSSSLVRMKTPSSSHARASAIPRSNCRDEGHNDPEAGIVSNRLKSRPVSARYIPISGSMAVVLAGNPAIMAARSS